MTENELYELNQLPEIDPDYVPKRAEPAQNGPARIMTKKAWILSLFFPVLSILASAVLIIWNLVYTANGHGFDLIFVTLFGLIACGIVPTVLIVRNRLDTSKFFIVKSILFALTVTGIAFALLNEPITLAFLLVAVIGELVFALLQKTDGKTKLCLILSSLVWGFIGFLTDFFLALLSFWR